MKYKKNNKGQVGLEMITKTVLVVVTIALLAIVSLLIFSVMNANSVIPHSSLITTVTNESGWVNSSGYSLSTISTLGFANPTIVSILNGSTTLTALNYTLSTGGVLTNSSVNPAFYQVVNITYTYNYNSRTANDADRIIANSSSGTTSFFVNMPTIFTVLGIAFILTVLGLLLMVVRRIRENNNVSSI